LRKLTEINEEFRETVKLFFARRYYLLTRYRSQHRKQWMDYVTNVKRERSLLLSHCEACQLIGALRATEKVLGDLAEVGAGYGASAKLIVDHSFNHRPLHLFDTFEGLPEVTSRDNPKFNPGDFRGSLESIRQYLGNRPVFYYKGLFPETAEPVKDKRFSFVHLDVDLYESTLAGLQFFYPRLSPGGILISHDYLSSEGVDAAFKEFFANKPEPVIELMGYQCMVVKLDG
jgi:O-methyltransferase